MLRHSYECCVLHVFVSSKIATAADGVHFLMARLIKLYGGLQLMKSAAAYGGLQRRLEALSRNALYNVHELAYDSPDLSVICYNPDLVKVFSLLSSSTDQDKPTVTVTYDTTFNLDECYYPSTRTENKGLLIYLLALLSVNQGRWVDLLLDRLGLA